MVRLPEEQRAALVLMELGDLRTKRSQACWAARETGSSRSYSWHARRSRPAERLETLLHRDPRATLRAAQGRTQSNHDSPPPSSCEPCRSFRADVRAQRRGFALLLPVMASPGLRASVLSAVSGGGGGTGGVAVSGALLGGDLAAKALIVAAVVGGQRRGHHDRPRRSDQRPHRSDHDSAAIRRDHGTAARPPASNSRSRRGRTDRPLDVPAASHRPQPTGHRAARRLSGPSVKPPSLGLQPTRSDRSRPRRRTPALAAPMRPMRWSRASHRRDSDTPTNTTSPIDGESRQAHRKPRQATKPDKPIAATKPDKLAKVGKPARPTSPSRPTSPTSRRRPTSPPHSPTSRRGRDRSVDKPAKADKPVAAEGQQARRGLRPDKPAKPQARRGHEGRRARQARQAGRGHEAGQAREARQARQARQAGRGHDADKPAKPDKPGKPDKPVEGRQAAKPDKPANPDKPDTASDARQARRSGQAGEGRRAGRGHEARQASEPRQARHGSDARPPASPTSPTLATRPTKPCPATSPKAGEARQVRARHGRQEPARQARHESRVDDVCRQGREARRGAAREARSEQPRR